MSENITHSTSTPLEVQHLKDLQQTAPVKYIPIGSPAVRALLPESNFHSRDDAIKSTAAVDYTSALRARVDELGYDSLTGMPTRKIFDEQMPRFAARASQNLRDGKTTRTLVFLMDLNNLKIANDLDESHAEGDFYLNEGAVAIKQASRPGDFKARIGGDEFAEVLEGISSDMIERIAAEKERLINAHIARQRIPEEVDPGMSIGYAVFEEGDSIESVIERADRMVYDKKTKRKSDREIMAMLAPEEGKQSNNFGPKFTTWIEGDKESPQYNSLAPELIASFEKLEKQKPGIFGRLKFLSKQINRLKDALYGEDEYKKQAAAAEFRVYADERLNISAYACQHLLDEGVDSATLIA